jgi:hypothetical protein
MVFESCQAHKTFDHPANFAGWFFVSPFPTTKGLLHYTYSIDIVYDIQYNAVTGEK